MAPLQELMSRACLSRLRHRLWDPSHRSHWPSTNPISLRAPQKLLFIGATQIKFNQSWETLATTSASTMSRSQQVTQSFSQHALWTTSVSGMPTLVKNCLESKFQALNATQFSSWLTARASCPDGVMARSEPFYHSLESSSMQSTMLTTTESLHWAQPMTANALSQVVWKVKSASGASACKPKSLSHPLKSTAVKSKTLELTSKTLRPFQLRLMGLASFGIWKRTLVSCACLNPRCSSSLYTIQMSRSS